MLILKTFNVQCAMPVSYTHLDVYKRQVYIVEYIHNPIYIQCRLSMYTNNTNNNKTEFLPIHLQTPKPVSFSFICAGL